MVGESHVAVLLEDGRICRIAYSEELPPLFGSTAIPVPVAKEKRLNGHGWVLLSQGVMFCTVVMMMERLHPVPGLLVREVFEWSEGLCNGVRFVCV